MMENKKKNKYNLDNILGKVNKKCFLSELWINFLKMSQI